MQYTLAALALAAAVQAIPAPVPMPQAVTAAISPSEAAPPSCSPTYPGGASFGIAVQNITGAAPAKRQVSTISDGQPQAPTGSPIIMAPVSMITDGQIQGGFHTMTMMPVAQIGDGQVQQSLVAPVTAVSDGQPQAPTIVPASTASAVTTVADSQPQAPTTAAVSPSSPVSSSVASPSPSSSPPSSGSGAVACKSSGTLEITLNGGVLLDAKGRTGYIASNYQFQFDKPPQAGAIYTSGFSVCGNGSLALGGSNVFYQCRSGDFYNLYNTNWAPQCSPVTIESLNLVDCAS